MAHPFPRKALKTTGLSPALAFMDEDAARDHGHRIRQIPPEHNASRAHERILRWSSMKACHFWCYLILFASASSFSAATTAALHWERQSHLLPVGFENGGGFL